MGVKIRRKKGIVELYGYYEEDILNLSTSLFGELSVKLLGITSGRIQSAYKEMKECAFKGTIFEYLAWIDYRFWLWRMNSGKIPPYEITVPDNFILVAWRNDLLFDNPEFDEYAKNRKGTRLKIEEEILDKLLKHLRFLVMLQNEQRHNISTT